MPRPQTLRTLQEWADPHQQQANRFSPTASERSSSSLSSSSSSTSGMSPSPQSTGSELPSFQDFVQEVKKQRRRTQVRDASRRLRQRQQDELDALKAQVHHLAAQLEDRGRQLQEKDSLIHSLCAAIDQRDATLNAVAQSTTNPEPSPHHHHHRNAFARQQTMGSLVHIHQQSGSGRQEYDRRPLRLFAAVDESDGLEICTVEGNGTT